MVEIELIEPKTRTVYLLRYLTLNLLTVETYPRIYVAIMQHLKSKRRPLFKFDGQGPQEVLDFSKEPIHCLESLDYLYDKLVMKDESVVSVI